ncbi:MAG TPA: cyclic nucleotide-binding domain-containing protein [Treponemataceae bacterium]|nr:cyclic nucleotide-binding domain-containing protein [Treponemataceae bacterium]
MPDASLEKIKNLCVERRYERGDVLFFENAPGDHFFIILEGELEIWKRYGQVDEVLLGMASAGQPIGEMALIDNQPRSATVRARTDAQVFVIAARDFNDLLKTENSIAITLLRSVTMMVRRSNEQHIADLDRQNHELSRAYAELKAAQEEVISRERLSVIGRFSSLILHDIRNPLSALKSRVELLRMNYENREYVDQSIEKINSDISRMEMIAAEFLDFSRGEIRLQMSIVKIGDLFERLQDGLAPKLEAGTIHLEIINEVHVPVILDEERMLRALINACENACKAMPDGGKLALIARIVKGRLNIEISDTGCGMPRDVLENMFKPFYSVSASGGTGLGMIIIKSIIDAHHGEVEISSRVGEGTRILMSLPLLM